jgi:16S rRNA (guanine527-N7)-methyltransferase
MENIDLLKQGLEVYKIDADNEIVERFNIYKETLLEWNEKINLTAVTDEREIIIKHFLDSASCVQSRIEFSGKKVIDVGTGAGFPGVPLKIVMPDIDLTLLDSLNKRVLFLNELTSRLGLKCLVVHGRAEDYGVKKGFREEYDIALSRAVASMNVLSEYTLPFVKLGGYLICQKGPSIDEEIEYSKKAIDVLGGRVADILSTTVYNSDFNHRLVKIEKVKLCPGKYPRKAGMVDKKPIV